MNVTFDKFPLHVKQRLDAVYFIAGNELLLEEESVALVVAEAQSQGFTETVFLEIARAEEWYDLLSDASSRSLFAAKRLIVVRLTRNIFSSQKAQSALQDWVREDVEETIMILRGWSWDYRFRTAAWFKTLCTLATTLIVESVPTKQVSHWIRGRAQALGLNLSTGAITELADLTDGNLYAAQQELEKLRLLHLNENQTVDSSELTKINWSISGVFDLFDTACKGNVVKLISMLAAVRREGTQPLLLVGAIASQLRKYHDLACGRRTRLTSNRRRIGDTVVKRIGRAGLESLLIDCAHLDSQQKGIMHGDSWLALESLLLNLAGYRNRTLDTDAHQLRIDYES